MFAPSARMLVGALSLAGALFLSSPAAADGPPPPTPPPPQVPAGGFPVLAGGDVAQGTADLAGRVVGGDPVVLGGLTDEAVHDVIRANLQPFLACYSRELARQPALSGTVTLKWLVKFSGRAEAVEVKSSTLGSAVVEQCTLLALSQLSFPPPARGHVLISYPLTFSP